MALALLLAVHFLPQKGPSFYGVTTPPQCTVGFLTDSTALAKKESFLCVGKTHSRVRTGCSISSHGWVYHAQPILPKFHLSKQNQADRGGSTQDPSQSPRVDGTTCGNLAKEKVRCDRQEDEWIVRHVRITMSNVAEEKDWIIYKLHAICSLIKRSLGPPILSIPHR